MRKAELAGRARVRSVITVAADKFEEIDARIRDLQRTRDALETLLNQQGIDPCAGCPIVQALGAEPSTP
ncbi:hypothetical protein [Arthrobacter agilis]|uniref:hypothetical protein n=1 Tax=Arthrobacter agilis TaxID=37921 RepID=UPI00278A9F88|nr:hypothetical protein [Arthrobacter agilis]MDQ0734674.1 hypothetical protein [Arthrobacter agilis]